MSTSWCPAPSTKKSSTRCATRSTWPLPSTATTGAAGSFKQGDRAMRLLPPPVANDGPVKRPRLPRDATITVSQHPRELYINMTITRMEHIQALNETLLIFARMMNGAEDD